MTITAPNTATDAVVDMAALFDRARRASRGLARADRNRALLAIADALLANQKIILMANRQDVAAETAKGTPQALIDRLSLSPKRLEGMAEGVRQLANLPDPLHRVLDGMMLENGLAVRQVTVPFGVIGMIYESRPNVTVDAATLALKAGSAAVLRGSANALNSNRVLVQVMREAISAYLLADAVQLIDSTDRKYVTELLAARGKVDLVIPRGGASLINHVVNNAKVPVIETGTGNCHVFVDSSADVRRAQTIIVNAKVQRPGVCNSAETLLVHQDVAEQFLPSALPALVDEGVSLRGCERTQQICQQFGQQQIIQIEPAAESDWETEYLDYTLAIKVVDSVEDAIDHINHYGTQHSESIVTESIANARKFQDEVDAAAVYVNASTRFTDGFVFGFGAEIGISTQKLHARGPMGLAQIVTYKYLIDGDGQIRE